MSLVPAFSIGLWNAWLLMLYFPLTPLLLKLVDRAAGGGDLRRKMGEGSGEKSGSALYSLLMLLTIAYSVFLPLKTGTAWLSIGLGVYAAGLALFVTALLNAAATPAGQLFTRGAYRYSRHPGYLSQILLQAGIGLACASWLFLLVSALLAGLLVMAALAEERYCLETFGQPYADYQRRTPRWLGWRGKQASPRGRRE